MKLFKRILLVFALLLFLVAVALVGILIFVDPNEYKGPIVDLVKEQTGRDLVIEGDIDLSVFPWIGLELGKVSLNNPKGFTDEQFVAIERVNIKVAFLPLFTLQTRVGELELKGLLLNLQQRADGVTNWDDLVAAGGSDTEAAPDTPAPESSPQDPAAGSSAAAETALAGLYIGGVDIQDANITWRDDASSTVTKIERFNLNTGRIRLGDPIKLKAKFALRNQAPKLIAGVELAATAALDLAAQKYGLNDIRLDIKASGPPLPGNEQALALSADSITADLNADSATIKQLILEVAGLESRVDINASNIQGDKPQVAGTLQLEAGSLREVMQTLALEIPVTADPEVLGKLKMETAFNGSTEAVELSDLNLIFDDSTLTGSMSVKNFEKPQVKVAMALDRINADRYLPPPVETPEGDETEAAAAAADAEIVLPVEMLRTLDVEGSFKIGELQVMNLKTANLDTGITAKNGLVDLKPLNIDLYDGQYRGAASLDVRGDKPLYATNMKLTTVKVGPLLNDFMEDGKVEGTASFDVNIKTTGERVSVLKENLNGVLEFQFLDGALKGINIAEKLREAEAKIKRKTYRPQSTAQKTDFAALEGNANIKKGVVSIGNFVLEAPLFRSAGSGTAALPTEELDVRVEAYIVGTKTGQGGKDVDDVKKLLIPLDIKGTFTEPKVEFGYKAYLQAIEKREVDAKRAELEKKRQATEAARKQKEAELKAEAEQRRIEEKERLRRELEAKKAAEKKKLEEKKKDLLKGLFD